MKVSIITVVYNNVATVKDAVLSVSSQTHSDIEYIVIDGGSTDGTKEVLEELKDNIDIFISEPDDGLYFAINKGIELATGDIVGVLNSDDVYCDNGVIEKVINVMQEKNASSVYADLIYVDRENIDKVVRYWRSGEYDKDRFLRGWMPPHPTFFVKRSVYSQCGLFNTTFQISADYELMLRFLYVHEITTSYLPEVIVKMRLGGKSNTDIKNRLLANKEDRKAWKINGLKPGFLTLTLKPVSKLSQYYKNYKNKDI